MTYNNLNDRQKEYVDRYIRNKDITREQALQLAIVREVLKEM